MTANRLPSQERYMALASRCDQLAATARTEGDRLDYLQRADVFRRLGAARLPEDTQRSPSPFAPRSGPGRGHGKRSKNAVDAQVSKKRPRQRLGA
jgi:hypothetical protein